jgi:hypothetical protein
MDSSKPDRDPSAQKGINNSTSLGTSSTHYSNKSHIPSSRYPGSKVESTAHTHNTRSKHICMANTNMDLSSLDILQGITIVLHVALLWSNENEKPEVNPSVRDVT